MSELSFLLRELNQYISSETSPNQISDLCEIIIEVARSEANLRIIRGATRIKERSKNSSKLNFDFSWALRECCAMQNKLLFNKLQQF